MKTNITILKLFYTSSGWLLKFSFWALPIALFFSLSSFLFIDNLLSSYERYLTNSYLGTQGRISIETTSKPLTNGIASYSKENKLIYSPKKIVKSNVVFKNRNKSLTKYAKFIVLDLKYLKQKFNYKNIDTNTIFVNEVFSKSMGAIDINKFKQIYLDDDEKILNISNIKVIDTGFLGSEPIIFITTQFANKLFGTIKQKKQIIEFLEKDTKNIKKLKLKINELSKEYQVLEMKIFDLLTDTKVTKEFFKKVTMIQFGISILLFILSLGVIILSISVSIEFKKNSLKILQLIGMSVFDLSFTISGVIFLIFMLLLGLSIFCLDFFQSIFLNISGFNEVFFIPINSMQILYTSLLGFILFIIVFISTKYIFKG